MPRIILKILEKHEDFTQFLQGQAQVESHLRIGPFFLINFAGRGEQDFALFQQEAAKSFAIGTMRELCAAKCRDGSDCLNTAKEGKYCRKHREVQQ